MPLLLVTTISFLTNHCNRIAIPTDSVNNMHQCIKRINYVTVLFDVIGSAQLYLLGDYLCYI